MKIIVAKDFSKEPWSQGQGKDFLSRFLMPQYLLSKKRNEKLVVDLDGCLGISTAFLKESFGGLALALVDEKILKHIEIICLDDEAVFGLIQKYVKEAANELDKNTRKIGGVCLVNKDNIAKSNMMDIYSSLQKAGVQNIGIRKLTEEEINVASEHYSSSNNILFEFVGDYPMRHMLNNLKIKVNEILHCWEYKNSYDWR